MREWINFLQQNEHMINSYIGGTRPNAKNCNGIIGWTNHIRSTTIYYIAFLSAKFNIVIELKCTEYGPIWKFGNKEVDYHYELILPQATLFLNGRLDKSILN